MDAVGFPPGAACGVGEVLNAIEPPASGAVIGSDDKKSMSRRSERTTRSVITRGDDPGGLVLPPPGRPATGLKLATHGSHEPLCESTTPTRFEGATASFHVLIGHVGSDRARSSVA